MMFDNFTVPDILPALPEIFLSCMALLILLTDAFRKSKTQKLSYGLSLFTLLGAMLLQTQTGTLESITFSGLFIDDIFADLLKLFVYFSIVMVLLYSRAYLREKQSLNQAEYYVLVLFATLGMMVMISANHFLSVYVGLELLSLSLYALVAIDRHNTIATEAAMKYFVLGALASGLLLYGMSMIYGATGSLEITTIANALQNRPHHSLVIFGLVFIVAGLAFKLGAVPFHMWIPDVYQGAPTPVTLLIASAPKIAAFAIVMRLLVGALPNLAADWQVMLFILAILSMTLGNLAAIAQKNIKRMLAYSAIAHMGFMLLGLGSGVVSGDPAYALNAYSASLFYIFAYVLMSLGTFGMVLILSHAGFNADNLDDYKGLNKRNPWLAFLMLVLMFSMAGIPFFVGFFAKFAVLQAVVAAGYYGVAVVAVLLSLVGAFYYLRVVKLMYFDPPEHNLPIAICADRQLLISFNALAVAGIGLFPQKFMALCAIALFSVIG